MAVTRQNGVSPGSDTELADTPAHLGQGDAAAGGRAYARVRRVLVQVGIAAVVVVVGVGLGFVATQRLLVTTTLADLPRGQDSVAGSEPEATAEPADVDGEEPVERPSPDEQASDVESTPDAGEVSRPSVSTWEAEVSPHAASAVELFEFLGEHTGEDVYLDVRFNDLDGGPLSGDEVPPDPTVLSVPGGWEDGWLDQCDVHGVHQQSGLEHVVDDLGHVQRGHKDRNAVGQRSIEQHGHGGDQSRRVRQRQAHVAGGGVEHRLRRDASRLRDPRPTS